MASSKTYQIAFALNSNISPQFQKTFDIANRNLDKFSSTFKTAASVALGAAGVTSIAGTAFGEGMNLEGFRLQLETATKSAERAAEIMKWSVDLANRTPFETSSVVEASARLEAMGLSAKKYLPMVGDMAAATNKDLMQATEAIIDAQVGEMERMKEFSIQRADIAQYAYEKMGKIQVLNNKGQITNQEKFNEAMLALMNERFAGGMEKQAGTMRGLMSTVSGILKSGLSTMIGITDDGSVKQGSIYERSKEKLQELANKMMEWQSDGTFVRISERISKVLDDVGTSISFVTQAFKGGVDVSTFQSVVGIMESLGVSSDQAKSVAEGLETGIGNVKTIISETLQVAKDICSYVVTNWTQIEPVVVGIATGLAGLKVGMMVWNVGKSVMDFYKNVMRVKDAIKLTVMTWGGLIKTKVVDIAQTLYLKALYGADLLKSLLASGKAIAANALAWTINTAQLVAQKVGLIALKGIQLASQGVTMALTAAQWALNAAFIASPIGWVVLGIGALIGVGVLLWKNWDTVKLKAFELWEGIKSAFGGIGEWFGGIWEGIKSTFKSFVNFIIGGLNKIPEALNNLNFTVPEWVPGIGGSSMGFNLPTIPMFARGTSYTPDTFIAGERGPELITGARGKRVYTADKTSSMLMDAQSINSVSSQSSDQFVFSPNITVNGGGADIEHVIAKVLDEEKEKWMKDVEKRLEKKAHDKRSRSFVC